MQCDTFEAEWKFIKKNYEKATGKKKPSAKLDGATTKATGIQPAAKAFDAALKAKDPAAAKKAYETIQSSADAYKKALVVAINGEDKAIADELKVLVLEVGNFAKEAKEKLMEASDDYLDLKTREQAWQKLAEVIADSDLAKNKAVRGFADHPAFGRSVVTQEADPKLAKCQQDAAKQIDAYGKALDKVKKFRIDIEDKSALKDFAEAVAVANDEIGVSGLLGTLGLWRLNAAGSAEAKKAYEESPLRKLMDAANDAVSAENERLGKLQQSFERQIARTR